MTIYIITHKNYTTITDEQIYRTLLVGADHNSYDSECLRDNSGTDNISSMNQYYCELTGLYWMWKNSGEDISGLCHYRRYFTRNRYVFQKRGILREKDISDALCRYDIICPLRDGFEYEGLTAVDKFNKDHDAEIWKKCREIIDTKYPDYIDSFSWFETQTTGYCYNMFICRHELTDSYCRWLFDILFELEKSVDYSEYDDYNKRMLGFLAERLLNVFIHHNNLRVKEFPVYYTDGPSFFRKVMNRLRK